MSQCYYNEPNFCSQNFWTCQTCGTIYCTNHSHSSSNGENRECVACEHEYTEAKEWHNGIEKVKNAFYPRIETVLKKLQEYAKKMGYSVKDIEDRTVDGDFQWSFDIHTNGTIEDWNENTLVVRFEISSSLEYEGLYKGVSFVIYFENYEGEIFNELTPYNYTDQCWASLDDTEELKKRMTLIESNAEYALETAIHHKN